MPARIVIFLPDLRGGGAERLHIDLGSAFIDRGHAVEFLLMRREGEWLQALPVGTGVVELGARRFRGALVPLVRYLRWHRPDALIAAMWPLTAIAVWARKLAQVPTRVFISDHEDYSATIAGGSAFGRFKLRLTMQSSYPYADGVIAVSRGVAATVAKFAGMREERIRIISNPVRQPADAELTRSCAAARAWAAHAGPRLIAIGTLKPEKDFTLLLSAFAKLREQIAARLLILGEGSERAGLRALCIKAGIAGSVDMPGFVESPYPYLSRADLFVLSSTSEGFGNVIVEALASGVPVVSTDCPCGPAEILENGKYGRLVPVGDAEALAAAMAEALDAPHDFEMLRRRGAEFSVERAADQYLALLDPNGRCQAHQ